VTSLLQGMKKPENQFQLYLTPKGRSQFFGPFLKFGQGIVHAIFVSKISNFW
jgi:hypothetical protein